MHTRMKKRSYKTLLLLFSTLAEGLLLSLKIPLMLISLAILQNEAGGEGGRRNQQQNTTNLTKQYNKILEGHGKKYSILYVFQSLRRHFNFHQENFNAILVLLDSSFKGQDKVLFDQLKTMAKPNHLFMKELLQVAIRQILAQRFIRCSTLQKETSIYGSISESYTV